MKRYSSIIVFLFFTSSCFCSQIITVDDDGPADFNNIQAAIDAADNNDVIIVADGFYFGQGNQNIDAGDGGVTNIILRSANGPEKCIIDGNGANYGFYFDGMQYGHQLPIALLEGFTITNCQHAIYLHQTGDIPTINNCVITGNSSNTYSCSGIVCLESSDVKISNCIITNNSSLNGVGVGGGVWCGVYSNAEIISCVISQNEAAYGGGIYVSLYSNPEIVNCTISDNSADVSGGGIYSVDSSPTVTNSILWGNTAPTSAQIDGSVTVSYSDVQGGYPGLENINADPCFVNPGVSDYHLKWDSPCKNSGDITYVYEQGATDIDGEPRVIPMTGPVKFPDMGADEVGPKQADFTRDGIINFKDFTVLANSWLVTDDGDQWYVLCDLVKDGHINHSDLKKFVDDWLWQAGW